MVKAKNPHDGHRGRVKLRFLKEGLHNFAPHEVIELLLFFGIPVKDTNELAHELLERFGSLSGVLEAPYEELKQRQGHFRSRGLPHLLLLSAVTSLL